MAKVQLKPEILDKLKKVVPAEQISNLDQSQIYLLSIPSIYKLVLDEIITPDELSEKNDLCFIRLQNFLKTDILRLIYANKISLQALSTICFRTVDLIIKHIEEILSDKDNQILLDILINKTPELWDTTIAKEPISPWNEKTWNKYKFEIPKQLKIMDDSALIYEDTLPTFAEMIADNLSIKKHLTPIEKYEDNDLPFSSTHDRQNDSDDFFLCSESMLSTSSPLPRTSQPRKLELSSLCQIFDGQDHTRPKLKGDTLHYFKRVKVKIPSSYDFSTEGLTITARKK